MSWTWLTGKMTKQSAQIHHEKWYREEEEGEPVPASPPAGIEPFTEAPLDDQAQASHQAPWSGEDEAGPSGEDP